MDSFWTKYGISAIAAVLIGVAFVVGVSVGEGRIAAVDKVTELENKESDPLTLNAATGEVVDFAPFWRVWNTLNNKYVPRGTSTPEIIDAQEKVWNAIHGLVEAYDDPYTVFLPPEETVEFKEAATGSFEGVGMVVGANEDGRLVVVSPLEDSPAMKAGLVAGDIIDEINGEDATNLSVEAGVTKIRGPKGTTVTITVSREDEGEQLSFDVVRGNIDIPSTATAVVTRDVPPPKETSDKEEQSKPSGTGQEASPVLSDAEPVEEEKVQQDFFVLRLFSFSQSSIRAFEKGLKEFTESGTNKLIVDLRRNPGGFLNSAVTIASYFVPEGEVVVREIFGAEQEERLHVSEGEKLLDDVRDDLELVVLIDRGSASASEILAGALQEYDIATLIGEKSFGKGSVQELVDITGDISLKVTIARWYTPNGFSISDQGLTPDIEVDLSTALPFTDPILDAAIDFLINDEKE